MEMKMLIRRVDKRRAVKDKKNIVVMESLWKIMEWMMKMKMMTIFLLVIIIISMIFLFVSSRFISYSLRIQNRPLQAPRLESISLLIFKLMSSEEEPKEATTDNIHNS